jgi:hypothetical protein
MKNFFLISILAIFAISCKKSEQTNKEESAKVSVVTTEVKANSDTPDYVETVTITTNGNTFAVIKREHDKAVITYDNQNILVHRRKDDKRKHELNGTIISEVKYKDDVFKLRNANSELKWKVKLGEGKAKISNNEEGNDAYELKVNDNGKAKIKRNEIELAEAKQKEKTIIEVTSKAGNFTITAKEFDRGYALLGLDEISKQDRLLLLVEFLEM